MTTISYAKNNTALNNNGEMDTLSLDSNELSDLGFEDQEQDQKKTSKEAFKTIFGTGNAALKMKIRQQETAAAKELRQLIEKQEAHKNAFKQQVFKEHEKTAMYSTQTSFKAGKVRKDMLKTIRANREIIPAFDNAIKKFDNTCTRVIEKETIRLEEERLHAEAVEANAGKELDFFQEPTLETAVRAQ